MHTSKKNILRQEPPQKLLKIMKIENYENHQFSDEFGVLIRKRMRTSTCLYIYMHILPFLS